VVGFAWIWLDWVGLGLTRLEPPAAKLYRFFTEFQFGHKKKVLESFRKLNK
jgi:hypothetical protein